MARRKLGKRFLCMFQTVVVHPYGWYGFRPIVQPKSHGCCALCCKRWWTGYSPLPVYRALEC